MARRNGRQGVTPWALRPDLWGREGVRPAEAGRFRTVLCGEGYRLWWNDLICSGVNLLSLITLARARSAGRPDTAGATPPTEGGSRRQVQLPAAGGGSSAAACWTASGEPCSQ